MVSTVELERIQQRITAFDFKTLFIEELGWNRHSRQFLIEVRGVSYTLTALAEKKDRIILLCESDAIPQHPVRVAIEHEIARLTHTHLIIFVDTRHRQQLWLYAPRIQHDGVSRQRYYSLPFYTGHSGLAIAQKISTLAIDISEEERLTGTQIDERLSALQVERVTKRFYDLFRAEHTALSAAIEGLPTADLSESYALALLNRLMFTYFIQKKSFLNDDPDYLRTKLAEMRNQGGFFTFYKTFLLTFFHDGLGKKRDARSDTVQHLLGSVPYLNGGLFEPHAIELEHAVSLDVPDAAFTRIFAFFDRYDWHLDTREMRNDNEINPDVLGYIFEKYINQKQMGAYYTKEDITEYISKNTIIPFVFDRLSQREIAAAKPAGSIWNLLREDPDRYLYDAVRHGVDEPLPNEIAAGIERVAERGQWNQSAPPQFALPTETWREHIARRLRCHDVRAKLRTGEITSINDLITYNLNIIQFALDAIQQSPDAQFLAAIHAELATITILDPTCGSGAFLFAALNILEPLYEASLDRMQIVVDEVDAEFYQEQQHYIQQFRTILKESDQHPNRTYAIDKGIIMRNLYGVDIMPEAVEIAKLRLFLTLVAHVDSADRIEPLPDIDFNIRAGNTLVGFAAETDVVRAIGLDMEQRLPVIRERAREVGRVYDIFRDLQTRIDVPPDAIRAAKDDVQRRLNDLRAELDRYLASEYGIDRLHIADEHHYAEKLAQWKASHQPFHWYAEFFDIMNDGGFDVIIGNPPYVEYAKVRGEYSIKGYATESCGNLYAFIMERTTNLMNNYGSSGMIVPHSGFCTERMGPLQHIFTKGNWINWISSYSIRPAKLFNGVDQRLAIYITHNVTSTLQQKILSSTYHHWHDEYRPSLFHVLNYLEIQASINIQSIPKMSEQIERSILDKLFTYSPIAASISETKTEHPVYFHNAPRYWIRAMDYAPFFYSDKVGNAISTQVKSFYVQNKAQQEIIMSAMNSSLFFLWFIVLSDCRHLNNREIDLFPMNVNTVASDISESLSILGQKLMEDYGLHAQRKETFYKTTGKVVYDEFYPRLSKPIIDEIDRVLAQHYGFTEEELDFIINYDIKYRMGRDAEERGEE